LNYTDKKLWYGWERLARKVKANMEKEEPKEQPAEETKEETTEETKEEEAK
jgi:hypothetical protein